MKFLRLLAATSLIAGPLTGLAVENCFSDAIRVTALVKLGGKAKVGIVEIANTNSAFVAVGGKAAGIEIVAIDYEKEIVTLKRGDVTCVLALAGDPNAPKGPMIAGDGRGPDSPDWRGEAIEKFLRENPDAVKEGDIKLAQLPAMPPVTGHGPEIDAFLSQHPEIARAAEKEAVGKGEGIENFLKQHPEIKIDDTPIPEGSLGPGIEEAMKKAGLTVETNGIPNLVVPPELAPKP